MSSQLDPAILAAITAEARQCFLDEDAPEYLQMLETGIADHSNPDYTALLRAAHSLKGGAGLASLTSLQNLAHKLEDAILGVQEAKIAEVELAWALIEKGIDEVGYVLSQARNVDDAIANPELIVALESLVGSADTQTESESTSQIETPSSSKALAYNTLMVDLEASFVAIEELELDTPEEAIEPMLMAFADECLFMAETLELPWLAAAITPITEALAESDAIEALLIAQEAIGSLRQEIADYLQNFDVASESSVEISTQNDNYELIASSLNQDLEEFCQAIADLEMETPESVIQEALTGFADECNFLGETLELPWLIEAVSPIESLLTEVEPLEALLTVQELVGEIRQQRDLYLANLVPTDEPEEIAIAIAEEDELPLYEYEAESEGEAGFFDFGEDEEEATLSTVMFAPSQVSQEKIIAKVAEESQKVIVDRIKIPLERLQGMTNNVEELILTYSRFGSQQKLLNQANRRLRLLVRQFEPIREQIQDLYDRLAIGSGDLAQKAKAAGYDSPENNDFDSLEMDRYTDLHGSLQSFQELMLQIARISIL